MIRGLIDEAVASGARRARACAALGISARTVQRWGAGERRGEPCDMRRGPNCEPHNKLSAFERKRVLETVNSPRFRDLPPSQIVPLLADEGRYLASEATMYRIMREESLLAHRGSAKPLERRGPNAHTATAADQVWSWDITYLKTPVRGVFNYLYLIMDVWSRRIVGWGVYDVELADLAAGLFRRTCRERGVRSEGIVLHSDNGGPMKGATMVATLEKLGVLASFSRPGVSNDNPFSEALFRTLKYCPEYPRGGFADLDSARRWVARFVEWYNTVHLHSGIGFVTPEDRHTGRDIAILGNRRQVYDRARNRNPARWSRDTRKWNRAENVALNPITCANKNSTTHINIA